MTSNQQIVPFALIRLRFHFLVTEPVLMPAYAGSTWRGLFGHSLRQLACVTRQKECVGCLLQTSCIYTRLFEPVQCTARCSKDKPRPFVFYPGPVQSHARQVSRPLLPGRTLHLDLTLIDQAIENLPYIITALERADRHGIGLRHGFHADGAERRGRVSLQQVEQTWPRQSVVYRPGETLRQPEISQPSPPPPPSAPIQLHWQTPFRYRTRSGIVGPQELNFHTLFSALLRRIEQFCATPQAHWRQARLLEQAKAVQTIDSAWQWHRQRRWSNRQKNTLSLSGIIGLGTFAAPCWDDLWPLLWIGQILHVGKGTVMGLGCYQLLTDASDHINLAKIDNELGKDKNFCEHPLQTIDNKGKINASG